MCSTAVLQPQFLGSENQIFPLWGVPARKFFDFWLVMAENLLILAYSGEELICTLRQEFVHFDETGQPRQENFNIFLANPTRARSKYLTFLAGILHRHKHCQTAEAYKSVQWLSFLGCKSTVGPNSPNQRYKAGPSMTRLDQVLWMAQHRSSVRASHLVFPVSNLAAARPPTYLVKPNKNIFH